MVSVLNRLWVKVATLVLMGAVSLYNVFLNAEYAARWMTAPEIYFAAPVPIITAVIAISLLRTLKTERHSKPFWLSIALFFFGPDKLMPIAKDLGARASFFSIDRLVSLCSLSSQSISCAGKSASGLKEVVEEFKTGMAEGETGVSQDGGATAVKSAEPAPEEKTDA